MSNMIQSKLEVPSAVLKEAERKGVDLDSIERAGASFMALELASMLSDLSEKDAESLSKKIKASIWKRIKR